MGRDGAYRPHRNDNPVELVHKDLISGEVGGFGFDNLQAASVANRVAAERVLAPRLSSGGSDLR